MPIFVSHVQRAVDARHRFPWSPDEIAYVGRAKRRRVSHKVIARELQRTPRAVDRQVARMKELGLLAMHCAEEMDLLNRVEAEAQMAELHPEEEDA